MTHYRDLFFDCDNLALADVVGCALDRLGQPVPPDGIREAIRIYRRSRADWRRQQLPIGARRQLIAEGVTAYLRASA